MVCQENIGAVYSQSILDKNNNETLHIEIAYRGRDQKLPTNAITFQNLNEMKSAIKVIAHLIRWGIPKDFPYGKVWENVSSGIGWSFHPSNHNDTIKLADDKKVIVYRKEINSTL